MKEFFKKLKLHISSCFGKCNFIFLKTSQGQINSRKKFHLKIKMISPWDFFEDYHFEMLHESIGIFIGDWNDTWELSSEALKCGEEFALRCLRSFMHVVIRYMYVSKWLTAGVTANTFVEEWRFLVGEGVFTNPSATEILRGWGVKMKNLA